MYKAIGKVIKVLSPEGGVSAKGEWKRQTFVIEANDGKYPVNMAFDVLNDRCNIPEIGELAIVNFAIKSREYNSKWYTSITAISIEDGTAAEVPPAEPDPTALLTQPAKEENANGETNTELPF